MPLTERLYYTNSYLKEFSARIIRSVPDPKGARVYLDRTAFYPDSGGQPSDHGTLAGIRCSTSSMRGMRLPTSLPRSALQARQRQH